MWGTQFHLDKFISTGRKCNAIALPSIRCTKKAENHVPYVGSAMVLSAAEHRCPFPLHTITHTARVG